MIDPYWADGKVTLYHGDCLDVLPQISDVALTVTSPPYNTLPGLAGSLGYKRSTGSRSAKARSAKAWAERTTAQAYTDAKPEDVYQEEQRAVAAAVAKASRPGASLFYNHKCRWRDRQLLHPYDLIATFEDWRLEQEIIWSRPGAPQPSMARFRVTDERIYWLVDRRGRATFDNRLEGDGTVWRMNPAGNAGTGATAHPAPFPNQIPWRAILSTTQAGDLVLDPYAGSGTTLRVARELSRQAVGIEEREDYCEMIVAGLGGDI